MASFTFYLLAVFLLATCSGAPQNTKSGITIPEECKGKGFCSIKPEGYDEIETKISELLPGHLIEFGSRTGSDPIPLPEDDDNCPSELKWESVYAFKDSGTDVDIIVQTELFPQQVPTVTCRHTGSQIRNKDGSPQCFKNLQLSAFLNFSCQESKAIRTLLIYDPQEHRLKMKSYEIPVCCSCRISKKENYAMSA